MRKNRSLLAAAGMMLVLVTAPAWAGQQKKTAGSAAPATNWREIAIPELPAFQPKLPKRVELNNGMVVFLTEDHELPLIAGLAMIRGGAVSEPAEKIGLVDLYGATWRTGGTEKLTGDQLDDFLEARAAKVETQGADEQTSIAFDCLKGDFPEVFGVFADLLRNPAFREEKLSLAKKQLYSSISRRNDETRSISSIQGQLLGYGKQSPYARIPEYATVTAVTRQDLLDWHSRYVAPNNIVLGIVGDFDAKQMEATLNKVFGNWPKGTPAVQREAPIQPEKPGIYLVNKSDVEQSEIRFVSLGIERRNPDYYALQVMNVVFGGGFASRLFVNLRTKEGLAYAVGGGVGSDWDHPGLTRLMIGTKTGSTIQALRGMWEQVDLMKTEPPTAEEIKRAKDSILNSFIFRLDTPAKVLHEQQAYEFYGYPSDFLQRYRAGIEKVTADDVVRVAKKYLRSEDFKVLVVGNASEFQTQLAELGPVTPVDITIPSPQTMPPVTHGAHLKPAAAVMVTASRVDSVASGDNPADAKEVLRKLAKWMGGVDKIASVKSMHEKIVATSERGWPVYIEQYSIFPEQKVEVITLMVGKLHQVITPSDAFMSRGASEIKEMTPAQQREAREMMKRNIVNVLQHIDDPNYSFRIAGKEEIDAVFYTIVEITVDGSSTRWWIGPEGKLLQESFSVVEASGRHEIMMRYLRWKEFDGVEFPTILEAYIRGSQTTRTEIQDVHLNPEIDMTLFERPRP